MILDSAVTIAKLAFLAFSFLLLIYVAIIRPKLNAKSEQELNNLVKQFTIKNRELNSELERVFYGKKK